MKKQYLVQASEDGKVFTTAAECYSISNVEHDLFQLEWIDPQCAWRAIQMIDDKIIAIGKTDFSGPLPKVIWTNHSQDMG